jgi:hypothetical protein
MSATASPRGLASPDSCRRPGAKRSHGEPPSPLDGRRSSAPGRPAGRAQQVPDPPSEEMAQQQEPTETFTEQLARSERERRGRLRSLWQMTVPERIAAMRRSDLTYEQLAAWSARHPDQVPVVHAEFEWIIAKTPEACVGDD